MEDIRLIRSFVATVVGQNSFSAAARALEITPAAVSKNVKRLEEELKVRLFSRTTRALRITDEGQLVYEHYANALRDIDRAHQVAANRNDELAGTVRITITSSFGRYIVLPLLSEILRTHPKLRLDVKLDDHLTDMIQEGFDIGIRGGKYPRNGRFVARRLAPLHLMVCGSPSYFARHPEPKMIEDLGDHECIQWRNPQTGKLFPWTFDIDGKLTQIAVGGRLICNDLEALAEAGLRADGLVMLGAYRVLPLIEAGLLRPVLGQFSVQSHYYIHYPNRQFLAPRTRVVVNFLIERIRTLCLAL